MGVCCTPHSDSPSPIQKWNIREGRYSAVHRWVRPDACTSPGSWAPASCLARPSRASRVVRLEIGQDPIGDATRRAVRPAASRTRACRTPRAGGARRRPSRRASDTRRLRRRGPASREPLGPEKLRRKRTPVRFPNRPCRPEPARPGQLPPSAAELRPRSVPG
jgi:hypothetical protein